MRFVVYEYEGENGDKTIPKYFIQSNSLQNAVKTYKENYMNKDYKFTETYYRHGDPYTALIYLNDKIIDSHDGREITKEDFEKNPDNDYLDNERYWSISEFAEITLCDEDRHYAIVDNKLHKIDELKHSLVINTTCNNFISDPQLIKIDENCVKDYEKCKECFKK